MQGESLLWKGGVHTSQLGPYLWQQADRWAAGVAREGAPTHTEVGRSATVRSGCQDQAQAKGGEQTGKPTQLTSQLQELSRSVLSDNPIPRHHASDRINQMCQSSQERREGEPVSRARVKRDTSLRALHPEENLYGPAGEGDGHQWLSEQQGVLDQVWLERWPGWAVDRHSPIQDFQQDERRALQALELREGPTHPAGDWIPKEPSEGGQVRYGLSDRWGAHCDGVWQWSNGIEHQGKREWKSLGQVIGNWEHILWIEP